MRIFSDLYGQYFEGRSSQWAKVRGVWLLLHQTCAACGGTTNLNVHHIKPFAYYPELELVPTNFLTLCEHPARNCHLNIGHSGDWAAYNPFCVEDAEVALLRRSKRLYTRLLPA